MNDPKASPSVVFTSKGDFFDPWIDKRRKAAMMMIVKAADTSFIDAVTSAKQTEERFIVHMDEVYIIVIFTYIFSNYMH